MNLKEILERNPELTVGDLQAFQREYDRRFVDDEFTGFAKVRHTYAHMGNVIGRIGKYVQMIEDGHKDFSPEDIKTKVIPDLLVYAGWLATEFGVNIEEAYLTRMVGNINRLHAQKISPEELAQLEKHITERFPNQL